MRLDHGVAVAVRRVTGINAGASARRGTSLEGRGDRDLLAEIPVRRGASAGARESGGGAGRGGEHLARPLIRGRRKRPRVSGELVKMKEFDIIVNPMKTGVKCLPL